MLVTGSWTSVEEQMSKDAVDAIRGHSEDLLAELARREGTARSFAYPDAAGTAA